MNSLVKRSVLSLAVAATLAGISCQPPAATPAAPAAQTPRTDNGRYQIVIGNEGTAGTVLFLLDTRDGGTWIYRPPTPPAFNGFWSDIPRITYPPETWQQVFSSMVQQAQQAQKAAQPAPAPAK
ncbi:MAG: hypothetical protein WCG79_05610 [Verrucomicrobiota bacterium]|jgi:hypothetical protein